MTRGQPSAATLLRRFWRAMRGGHVERPGPFEVVAFVLGYMTLLITGFALLTYFAVRLAELLR